MSTLIVPPDRETLEVLQGISLGTFLDGECYAFAIAFNRAFNWPITGLMSGNVIRHALVREPSGVLRDTRDRIPLDEVGKPFGMVPPYELRVITEESLFAVRPISERTIEMARKLSEYIWTDLPWNGEASKAKAFTDELEALSRKHGIWIRAPYPATMPILSEAFGEEAGYTLTPTANAAGYMIDRRLK